MKLAARRTNYTDFITDLQKCRFLRFLFHYQKIFKPPGVKSPPKPTTFNSYKFCELIWSRFKVNFQPKKLQSNSGFKLNYWQINIRHTSSVFSRKIYFANTQKMVECFRTRKIELNWANRTIFLYLTVA